MGKYLEVDLSSNKIREPSLDFQLAKRYIGGKGLGSKILYDNVDEKVDPLGSENILLFMTGPLSGTMIQTSGRWCVVTKSPHTGLWLDSQVGGKFGHRLKKAGFDYVIIRGKAPEPSYLDISSDGVEVRSAADLWGKGTFETEKTLKERHEGVEVCSIGPAGENLVTLGNIMTDNTHVAGRGGAGAVMGSKNLKAVIAKGTTKIEAANVDKYKELVKPFNKKVRENPGVQLRTEIGTPMWVMISNKGGFLPTRNYQSGVFEGAEAISGEKMRDEFVTKNTSCYSCSIACGKVTKFTEGKYAGLEVDGPEYETIALMGSNCGIDDLAAVAKASKICDDLGIDTISAGGTISFAMECSEKGILSQQDVKDLKFGNDDAMHEMLHLIAHRKGIGDLFAKGSLAAAKQLGQNSSDFAIQVKGLELAGVEPRGSYGMALAYSTSDRGGCHQRCWTPGAELSGDLPRFSMKGVPKFVRESQDERAACFSLVLCDFVPFSVSEMVDILNAATGFSYTPESYLLTGERIWNLTRLFSVREGISAKDDVLPERFSKEPAPEGPAKGNVISKELLEKAKAEYYQLRGWDANGIPTEEKLKSLDLAN